MAVFDPLESTSLLLYGILGIACAVSVIYSLSESDVNRYRTQQCFHVFLSSFVTARILWFALKAADVEEVITFTLNRIGLTLYFTVFTLVLFYWVENYHKTYVSSHEFLPRFFWVFVGCNAVMYVFEATIVILYVAGNHEDDEGNTVYNLSIYTIIALSFLVSLVFFIYGIRLYIRHRLVQDFEMENRASRTSELMKIFLCTTIFCACFLVRGCAFLYRPIFDKHMNQEEFLALGYFIPELIPSFVEFYVIRSIKQQDRQQSQFIETLYQEEEALRDPALPLDTFTPPASPKLETENGGKANEKSPLL